MKKMIFFVLAFCTLATAFAQNDVKLKNRMDSVSYAVGVSMWEGSTQFRLNLDYEMMAKGLIAASEERAYMIPDSANAYIQRVIEQGIKSNIAERRKVGEEFMRKNLSTEGTIQTESGLQYKIITLGTGATPSDSSMVKVNYSAYKMDGDLFDSSEMRGGPANFSIKSIIKGWQEMLKMMPVGTKVIVFIPPDLAYGDEGNGRLVKPGETLMYEIELLDILE